MAAISLSIDWRCEMTREQLINELEKIGDGINTITDDKNRLYQGIVKNGTILFYVDSMGGVFQNKNHKKPIVEPSFKEIGQLQRKEDFEVIAVFNEWI